MKKYCVIGWPLIHTDSPKLHNEAFRQAGISAAYEARPIEPETLGEFMQNFRANFAGANVTIPYKVEVMRYLDEVDSAARAIGAVNTIVNDNGNLIGFNTDAFGARAALEFAGASFDGARVLVLGAGGAARAIVYAMREACLPARMDNHASVSIYNRDHQKAMSLALAFGVRALSERPANARNFDIIINASACGMSPNENETPLPDFDFSAQPIVMDIVYKPLITKLLADASASGCIIVTGDKMLKLQAQESFRLWTGRSVDFLSL